MQPRVDSSESAEQRPPRLRVFCWVAPLALLVPLAGSAVGQQRQPVYVGAQMCAPCHDGRHMGDQFTRWYLSRHASAYT